MCRTFVFLILLTNVVCTSGCRQSQIQKDSRAQEDSAVSPTVRKLQQQRLALLQDRVAEIKNFVDAGRADPIQLIEPEMDLIRVKIEYAQSNDERKTLYGQLLTRYDKLIELAEFFSEEPVPLGPHAISTRVN